MDFLLDEVLSWKAVDIFDDGKFLNAIENLPDHFESSCNWYQGFNTHILEEFRVATKNKLEILNLDRVVSFEVNEKSHTGHFEVEDEENAKLDSGVIFAIIVRQRIGQIFPQNALHFFCKIKLPKRDKEDKNPVKSAEFIFSSGSSQDRFFSENGVGWELYLTDIALVPSERILEALHSSPDCGGLLKELLSCTVDSDQDPVRDVVHRNAFTKNKNDSQAIAINKVMSVVEGDCVPRIQVIHGPPGTGKTSTLVGLILTLVDRGVRVYASAPTNFAVAELARRTLAESGGGQFSAHQMVLVGNRSRLPDWEEVDRVHLDGRVGRLAKHLQQARDMSSQLRGMLRSMAEDEDGVGVKRDLVVLCDKVAESCEIIAADASDSMLSSRGRATLTSTFEGVTHLGEALREMELWDFDLWRTRDKSVPVQTTRYLLVDGLQSAVVGLISDVLKYIGRINIDKIRNSILENVAVIFSTVSSAGSWHMQNVKSDFQVAIIDEATQLVEASTAIMLSPSLQCLVLAGDHKQLPSTVISPLAEENGYGRSLFERLLHHNFPNSLLNVQYRMHPRISKWPNQKFYEGKLVNGANVMSGSYTKSWHGILPPLSVLDVRGTEEGDSHGSIFNMLEIAVAVSVVKLLYKHLLTDTQGTVKVGLVTPYSAQLSQLETRMTAVCASMDEEVLSVVWKTVDGFQGQECDVILFLAVRSNVDKGIGFLKDLRRLNVAITRPRYSLAVIGNCETLSHNKHWHHLIKAASGERTLFTTNNTAFLHDVVFKHNKQQSRVAAIAGNVGSDLFEKCVWAKRVSFTEDFQKAFTGMQKGDKERVIDKVLRLANGRWQLERPRGIPDAAQSDTAALLRDIVFTFPMGSRVLVWSVEIKESALKGVQTSSQWIKLCGLVLPSDLAAFMARIVKSMLPYSEQYLARCRHKECSDDKKHVPKVWSQDPSYRKLKTQTSQENATETTDNTATKSLLKTYPLSTSVARLLLNVGGDVSMELPHDVSADEEALILEDGPHFVLGRSGTGKTTIMMYRMLRNEQLFSRLQKQTEVDKPVPLRQMLVTASPVLAAAISRTFEGMMDTYRLAEQAGKDTETALTTITAAARNITSSAVAHSAPTEELVRFDQCRPEAFPLIITYEAFLHMLDSTLITPFHNSASERRTVLVDFARFQSRYFPLLGDVTANGEYKVEAAALFTEIMSVIKGSLDAVKSDSGRMSREDYVKLSEKRSSNMGNAERHHHYNLFETYQGLLGRSSVDYDAADFVSHVHRALRKRLYSGPKLKAIYVDEVQDLTPAQIALFSSVCGDPKGVFFAGDTAQTIAHGVGFRFASLKDLFFETFLGSSRVSVPEVTQLRQNFRTHAQVLKLANTVIKLLHHFFPSTIDKVCDEESAQCGPVPVFLSDTEDVVSQLFQRGDMQNCEFGSEQAILVRDEATKEQVRSVCGSGALVLTVQEAKGMEFTDCLIYNFFSSSGLGSAWRVLGGAYEAFDTKARKGETFTKFDEKLHLALCLELKKLYVLLTRSRIRIFIFEGDEKVRDPVLKLWTHPDIEAVEFKPFDQDVEMVLRTASKSSPEEWCKRGREFFARNNFDQARMCFERGGDLKNERLSFAKLTASRGDAVILSKPAEARTLYLQAAEAFLSRPHLVEMAESAKYCKLGGDLPLAAERFKEAEMWIDAGDCFDATGDFTAAATAFVRGEDLSRGVECCYKGNKYDHALVLFDSVISRGGSADSSLCQQATKIRTEVVKRGADHFDSRDKVEEMMRFVQLLESPSARSTFLKRRKHFTLLVKMELDDGHILEAAQLYQANGNYSDAAPHFMSCEHVAESVWCSVKTQRLALLDSEFLPSELASKTDKERVAKALKTIASDAAKNRLSDTDLAGLRVEINILTTHTAFSVDQLWALVQNVDDTPSGLRLKLVTLRCIVRNCQKETSTKKDFLAKWMSLDTTVKELVDCVSQFSGFIDRTVRQTKSAFRMSAADEALMTQLLDCLEVTRNTMVPAAKSYFVDDIAATRRLWSQTTITTSTTTSSVTATNKQKTRSAKRQEINLTTLAAGANAFLGEVRAQANSLLLTQLERHLAFTVVGVKTQYQKFVSEANTGKPVKIIQLNTMVRFSLLQRLFCLQVESLGSSHNDEAAATLAKMYQLAVIESLLPANQLFENMREVCDARRRNVFLGIVKKQLPIDGLHHSQVEFETVARLFLLSELTGTVGRTCSMVEKAVEKKQKQKVTNNALLCLCRAFGYEAHSAIQPRTLLHLSGAQANAPVEDMFFTAIKIGGDFVGLNWKYAGNPLFLRDGMLSPFTFLALAEKYLVLLTLYRKAANGVLLSRSLAVDVLCRVNPAYANFIEGCTATGRVNGANCQVATELLKQCTYYLIDWLAIGRSGLRGWFEKSAIRAEGRNAMVDNETVNTFVMRAVQLLSSVVVNIQFKGLSEALINKLLILVNRPDRDLLHGLPHHLCVFLQRTSPRDFLGDFSGWCRQAGDEMLWLCTDPFPDMPVHAVRAAKAQKIVMQVADEPMEGRKSSKRIVLVPAAEVEAQLAVQQASAPQPVDVVSAGEIVSVEATVTEPDSAVEHLDDSHMQPSEEGEGAVVPPPPPGLQEEETDAAPAGGEYGGVAQWIRDRVVLLCRQAKRRFKFMSPEEKFQLVLERAFLEQELRRDDEYVLLFFTGALTTTHALHQSQAKIGDIISDSSDSAISSGWFRDDLLDLQERFSAHWDQLGPGSASHKVRDITAVRETVAATQKTLAEFQEMSDRAAAALDKAKKAVVGTTPTAQSAKSNKKK